MNAVIRRAQLAARLTQTLGPGWVAIRARHEVLRRAGSYRRRLPAVPWSDLPLAAELTDPALLDPAAYLRYRQEAAPAFFFSPADRAAAQPYFADWDRATGGPLPEMDALARGTLTYFSHTPLEAGFPPDWHRNPFTGDRITADRHWSEIDDFSAGDIKAIWEASRFGFGFGLVRAYWRTGDDTYAELFWQALEDWRATNPPQVGPNWKCGQETSLRVMAWCFALYGLLDAPATTPERVAALAQAIALSGHRIEVTLDYALSQQNNHGVSEGTGLWTIGALFPELRDAARWRRLGRAVLERLGRELIDADGAFSQHSTNYHRLILQAFTWSLRLAELHGEPFSLELRERVARAADLLWQLQDDTSGRVPTYGANDGALILPLSTSDYRDFRPVIQSARFLATNTRTFPAGPWDEVLFWLFGSTALPVFPSSRLPVSSRTDLSAHESGYYTLRARSGFAFVRCPARFRHRPSHADALHLDLWWRGLNIALDPGTYSYNAPSPWQTALAETAVHNTVSVDRRNQMDRISRFLWAPWLTGRHRLSATSPAGSVAYWEGEHDGYRRLPDPVRHRRALLRLGDEHWLVLDHLTATHPHAYRLHWLLPDYPHRRESIAGAGHALTFTTPQGIYAVRLGAQPATAALTLVRADPDSQEGWTAPYYHDHEPALSVGLTLPAATGRFWTVFGPAGYSVALTDAGLTIATTNWSADVATSNDAASHLLIGVTVDGEAPDALVIPT